MDYPDAPALKKIRWKLFDSSNAAGEQQRIAQSLYARSAIVIDATTGEVLLDKNADEEIPPASLTKLVAMYTALKSAALGEISLDDIVDLPQETWHSSIPPGSSLMFLDRGQIVTVRELLLGMAVVSGNDAALALALHISGSVPDFVERMNQETAGLGLKRTRFVEPSGLSELNMTTAREFASFSREYISAFPQSLSQFHSRSSMVYPDYHNMAQGAAVQPMYRESTNKLLGTIDGLDGLKTGYIIESGYNIALTAERRGTRILAVIMGGPGRNTREGNEYRKLDGEALLSWAFSTFMTVNATIPGFPPPVVLGGTEGIVNAIPATDPVFSVPFTAEEGQSLISDIQVRVLIPRYIKAPVTQGQRIGSVEYRYKDALALEIPLIADRNSERASSLRSLLDTLASPLWNIGIQAGNRQ